MKLIAQAQGLFKLNYFHSKTLQKQPKGVLHKKIIINYQRECRETVQAANSQTDIFEKLKKCRMEISQICTE